MTPPFPPNGPGTQPMFDGHALKLLNIATSPEFLESNVARLGKELEPESQLLEVSKHVPWPVPEESPLGQMLTREALLTWDFDLFKLKEVSDGHVLVYMSHGFIRMFDLVNKLKIDEATLHRSTILFVRRPEVSLSIHFLNKINIDFSGVWKNTAQHTRQITNETADCRT
jgi:hypothetical protein